MNILPDNDILLEPNITEVFNRSIYTFVQLIKYLF